MLYCYKWCDSDIINITVMQLDLIKLNYVLSDYILFVLPIVEILYTVCARKHFSNFTGHDNLARVLAKNLFISNASFFGTDNGSDNGRRWEM